MERRGVGEILGMVEDNALVLNRNELLVFSYYFYVNLSVKNSYHFGLYLSNTARHVVPLTITVFYYIDQHNLIYLSLGLFSPFVPFFCFSVNFAKYIPRCHYVRKG